MILKRCMEILKDLLENNWKTPISDGCLIAPGLRLRRWKNEKVTLILGHRGEKIEYTTDRENIIDVIEYHFTTDKLLEIELKGRTILLNLRNVIFTKIQEVDE